MLNPHRRPRLPLFAVLALACLSPPGSAAAGPASPMAEETPFLLSPPQPERFERAFRGVDEGWRLVPRETFGGRDYLLSDREFFEPTPPRVGTQPDRRYDRAWIRDRERERARAIGGGT